MNIKLPEHYPNPAIADFTDLHAFITQKDVEASLYAQKIAEEEMEQSMDEANAWELTLFQIAGEMQANASELIEKHLEMMKKYPKPIDKRKQPLPSNHELALEGYIQERLQRYILESNILPLDILNEKLRQAHERMGTNYPIVEGKPPP